MDKSKTALTWCTSKRETYLGVFLTNLTNYAVKSEDSVVSKNDKATQKKTILSERSQAIERARAKTAELSNQSDAAENARNKLAAVEKTKQANTARQTVATTKALADVNAKAKTAKETVNLAAKSNQLAKVAALELAIAKKTAKLLKKKSVLSIGSKNRGTKADSKRRLQQVELNEAANLEAKRASGDNDEFETIHDDEPLGK